MVTQAYNLDEDEIRNAITLNNIAQGRNDKFEDYFDTSKNAIYRPHISAGLGLKIAMNENFVLSVDWAAAIDKQDNGKMTNFYIKMGYLF